ncbi:MAG: hypothetical protein OXE55_05035 [Flavobacteriaceae bacterium]|nr:hypothetical protein [Flavobacteriaceae bacterium]
MIRLIRASYCHTEDTCFSGVKRHDSPKLLGVQQSTAVLISVASHECISKRFIVPFQIDPLSD